MSTEKEMNFDYQKSIDVGNDGDGDEDDSYGEDEDEDDDEFELSQLFCFKEMMFIWTQHHHGSSSQGCPLSPLSVERFYKWSPSELFSFGDYGATRELMT